MVLELRPSEKRSISSGEIARRGPDLTSDTAGARDLTFASDLFSAGAASRFRPIVLTAVTTCVGLTPLMLEGSLQPQILIPMAISLAFGVIFATVITRVLAPCGNRIVEDVARLWSRPLGRRPRAVDLRSQDEAAW